MEVSERGLADQAQPVLAEWARELERHLDVDMLGFPILAYDSVASTNDLLKELALEGAPEGLAVVAREQTRGRGRLGRTWVSQKGQGVYLSVLLKPPLATDDTKWLSLLVSVATIDALLELGLKGVSLKWPNDLLVREKKIAGILVEPRLGRTQIHFAVVGIGVNVRGGPGDWPAELKDTVTSFLMEGIDVDCSSVITRVLSHLDRVYLRMKRDGPTFLAKEWEAKAFAPPPQ